MCIKQYNCSSIKKERPFGFVHLLFVAAAIGLFQGSLQKVQAEFVDGGFEEVVLHQTAVQAEKEYLLKWTKKSFDVKTGKRSINYHCHWNHP